MNLQREGERHALWCRFDACIIESFAKYARCVMFKERQLRYLIMLNYDEEATCLAILLFYDSKFAKCHKMYLKISKLPFLGHVYLNYAAFCGERLLLNKLGA